jgi:putative ABC transport system ATP-binding protein
VVAIMGESGVGKSTLLNLVAGLDRPDEGRIVLDGVDLAALDDDAMTRLRRERFGFVFQAFHLLPYLTVAQNVGLPLALLQRPVGARERRIGEMQRIAIARALVHGPSLVLADEPTGNLDPDSASGVLALLHEQVRANDAAAIVVTHSLLAARAADRVVVLTRDGLRPRDA